MGRIRKFEAQVFRRFRRSPPESKVHRITFWLLVINLILLALGVLPGTAGIVFNLIGDILLPLLVAFAVALLWQVVMRRMLWKVRNRLIVTYVLMGLTPIVLRVYKVLCKRSFLIGRGDRDGDGCRVD